MTLLCSISCMTESEEQKNTFTRILSQDRTQFSNPPNHLAAMRVRTCQVDHGWHDQNHPHPHPHHSYPKNLPIIISIQTTLWQWEWGHRQVGSPTNSLEPGPVARSRKKVKNYHSVNENNRRNQLSEQELKPTHFNGLVITQIKTRILIFSLI